MPRLHTFTLLLLLSATCGCSSISGWTDSWNPFHHEYVMADARNPATELACIWRPGEGTNERGIPARGFAGQVFFFTKASTEPVLVDGDVRIYLFADRGTPEERAKPLRQFDFTPEAWALHATQTSLGVGYTVFVPYPEIEPYQVRCQLRARLTPRVGATVWSEAVTITLDGPPQPGAEPASWAGANRNVSPPTVISNEIVRRSGTLKQLADADPSAEQSKRQLRTETFNLSQMQQTQKGQVQQIGYEVPAETPLEGTRSAPVELDEDDVETLRAMLKAQATSKKRPVAPNADARPDNAQHPLRSTSRRPSQETVHPLSSSSPIASDAPDSVPVHPFLAAISQSQPAPQTAETASSSPVPLLNRRPSFGQMRNDFGGPARSTPRSRTSKPAVTIDPIRMPDPPRIAPITTQNDDSPRSGSQFGVWQPMGG